jgi:cell division inhibitor SulA
MKLSAATDTASSGSGSSSGCVDAGSRAVVVSWLVEVGEEFALQQESLHAAVGLLDRFLASTAVSHSQCVTLRNLNI